MKRTIAFILSLMMILMVFPSFTASAEISLCRATATVKDRNITYGILDTIKLAVNDEVDILFETTDDADTVYITGWSYEGDSGIQINAEPNVIDGVAYCHITTNDIAGQTGTMHLFAYSLEKYLSPEFSWATTLPDTTFDFYMETSENEISFSARSYGDNTVYYDGENIPIEKYTTKLITAQVTDLLGTPYIIGSLSSTLQDVGMEMLPNPITREGLEYRAITNKADIDDVGVLNIIAYSLNTIQSEGFEWGKTPADATFTLSFTSVEQEFSFVAYPYDVPYYSYGNYDTVYMQPGETLNLTFRISNKEEESYIAGWYSLDMENAGFAIAPDPVMVGDEAYASITNNAQSGASGTLIVSAYSTDKFFGEGFDWITTPPDATFKLRFESTNTIETHAIYNATTNVLADSTLEVVKGEEFTLGEGFSGYPGPYNYSIDYDALVDAGCVVQEHTDEAGKLDYLTVDTTGANANVEMPVSFWLLGYNGITEGHYIVKQAFSIKVRIKDEGIVKENGQLVYYKNGVKDTSVTALSKYFGKWYYIKNGVKTNSTLLFKHTDGKWYHIKNGVKSSDTILFKHTDGKWYHIKNGVKTNSTLLFKHTDGKWYYIKNGVKTNSTLLFKHTDGKWYHIKNGVKTNSTLLFKHTDGKWYYIKNGVKTNSTLLFKHTDGKWYHIKNGVKSNDTTLFKHTDGKWYYIKNGVKNSSTCVMTYNKVKRYVKGGVWQSGFSGKVKIGTKTYTVKKGNIV